jgi:hypothetical protein
MNFKNYFGLIISVVFVLSSCHNPNHSIKDNKTNSIQTPDDSSTNTNLVVGGLYILKNNDNSYSISKILAIDIFAVHLRSYSNKFKQEPTQLSSDTLKILIGHAPLDKQGFLVNNPRLLRTENVKESELEGYSLYLQEMNK